MATKIYSICMQILQVDSRVIDFIFVLNLNELFYRILFSSHKNVSVCPRIFDI